MPAFRAHPPWLVDAARFVLPDHVQTMLLKACLLEPAPANDAWKAFARLARDPQLYFEASDGGLKGLLPYVESQLTTRGIETGPAFRTYARVALVREELRGEIYQTILTDVLGAMRNSRLECVLLKGAALSKTVYPVQLRRHNHGIDLLVREHDLAKAGEVLLAVSCEYDPTGNQSDSFRFYDHSTGLSLSIRTRLFDLPYLDESIDAMWDRRTSIRTATGAIHTLTAEDNLVQVLGEAAYSATRNNLRWVCDSCHILEKTDAPDWQTFCETTIAAGLELPVYVMLGYLKQALGAPVPELVIQRLSGSERPTDRGSRNAMHAFLLTLNRSRTNGDSTLPWPFFERASMLLFRIFPPPSYLRWKHRARSRWEVTSLYARRPLRYLVRRFGWGAPRPSGTSSERIHSEAG